MPTGIYPRRPAKSYARVLEDQQVRARHWRIKFPEKSLLRSAQKRSVVLRKKFKLILEDIVIPKKCPVLGIPLIKGGRISKDYAPSIDEIVPGKGYVPGNIAIISWRANRLKSDATLIEMRKLLAYYEAHACR